MIPKEYRYTKSHEWLSLDGENLKIGITDHAQSELGDVVFVELPEPDAEVSAGDVAATIESVKTVAEVYSPLAGRVASVNGELEGAPELINQDPHGQGWILMLEVEDVAGYDELMDAEAYENFLEEEGDH